MVKNKLSLKKVGDKIGVNWKKYSLDQFSKGMTVEKEHGKRDPQTNVTNNDPVKTGKIVLAHLKENKDYYSKLAKMEKSFKKKK